MRWILLAAMAVASPAIGQDHGAHVGHDAHAGHGAPEAAPAAPAPAVDHSGHRGHGTASPATDAPAPVTDFAADKFYPAADMARARAILAGEHGGARFSKVMADELEVWDDGYRWDVSAAYGGDLHRAVFKSEGEGEAGEGPEAAEVQLLYSRAATRYTDLQLGLRYDLEPGGRAYLAAGFETLLPYWIEAEGAVFLSDEGEVLARLEGAYDLRLTQRLILQPAAEINLAATESPRRGRGSGLTDAEAGVRLRYEIRRTFAPYIGLSWERSFGGTADYARLEGHEVEETRLLVGLRAWF
jgi:copper resistance protein B